MKKNFAFAVTAALAFSACASVPATSSSYAPQSTGGLNPNGAANYGTITLNAGFDGDPRVIDLRAGGSINASSVGSSCSGFVTGNPDVKLNYSAGSLPLIISVAAQSDTTLVINGPDGRWYCNDDGGVNGLNPSLRWNSPASGRYDIWVGTYSSGSTQPARLHISELSSQ